MKKRTQHHKTTSSHSKLPFGLDKIHLPKLHLKKLSAQQKTYGIYGLLIIALLFGFNQYSHADKNSSYTRSNSAQSFGVVSKDVTTCALAKNGDLTCDCGESYRCRMSKDNYQNCRNEGKTIRTHWPLMTWLFNWEKELVCKAERQPLFNK